MALRNSRDRYGSIAQLLHWVIAALVLLQFALGLYAAELPLGIERLQWLSRHKSLGALLLVLVLLRLAWRLLNRAPPLPSSVSRNERRLATFTHVLLYLLLIAAPLAGWLYASATGLGVAFPGGFALPDLVARDPGLASTYEALHRWLVWMLGFFIVLHLSAALRHVVRGDGIMQRMLPRLNGRGIRP